MTAGIIESITFEEVVSNEDWDIPCSCFWHKEQRGPAEWAVTLGPWCCVTGTRVVFWCNECLKEVMAYEGPTRCVRCDTMHLDFTPRDQVLHVEPIRKEAA